MPYPAEAKQITDPNLTQVFAHDCPGVEARGLEQALSLGELSLLTIEATNRLDFSQAEVVKMSFSFAGAQKSVRGR